jgi:DNA-binding CsgD family transcriptional regulator
MSVPESTVTVEPLETVWFPAIVLDLPARDLVAGTQCAHEVMRVRPGQLVGHNIDEFLTDRPTGGMELVASQQLTGFEVTRHLRATNETIEVSVRAVSLPGGRTDAVCYLTPRVPSPVLRVPQPGAWHHPTVGAVNGNAVVTFAAHDSAAVFGRGPDGVIGSLLPAAVVRDDAARVARMIDIATRRRRVASGAVTLRPNGPVGEMRLILLPASRPGTAVFLAVPDDVSSGGGDRGGAEHHPALEPLSNRQREIVLALVEGDRVPAIAQRLSLSQGTVRNYLSASFRKLGIATQQQLIDLVRRP